MLRICSTFFCLLLSHFALRAAVIVYVDEQGRPFVVTRPEINDATSALAALANPPQKNTSQDFSSGVLPGSKVLSLQTNGETTVVEFSSEIIGDGLDDARLETIFEQVSATLEQFDLPRNIRLQAKGQGLSSFLRPSQPVSARTDTEPIAAAAALVGLSGKKISLSPGHGLYWNGSSFVTQRPVYCSPLNQEDYHNLEISKYLDTYLAQDGATVLKYRAFDKNYGNYVPSGHAFWHMAGSYWLQESGYPCSVYANSTGGCTLGSGTGSELNDNIRGGPVASNFDNTDAHVSLHSNGFQGDCAGTGCPNGTSTYYDSSSEHAAFTTVSSNLAKKVQSAMISAIRTKYVDSTWTDRGALDSNGSFAETRVPDRAAILIELAFHDSCDRDAVALRDNFFRSTTMWAVYKGICDYFGTTPTWDYYSYEMVTNTIPAQLNAGSTNTVQITVRNRGVLWNDAKLFRLGAVGDSDPFSVTRYNVGSQVEPNVTKTFTLTLVAPRTTGTYTTDWQMLREGVTWFGPILSKSIVVVDTQPPTVPTNLTANVISPVQINLNWNPSTDNVGVSNYLVYRNSALIGSSVSTNFANSNCSPATAYLYQVSAKDAAGNESAKSGAVQATTPTAILNGSFNEDSLTLTWTNGVLQEASALTGSPGDWADVPGATSPYSTSMSAAAKYFRIRY
ncbi:MAG: N-acetylmuramoyl-L-alanine amidase [Verrucomicrobiota bacterium]